MHTNLLLVRRRRAVEFFLVFLVAALLHFGTNFVFIYFLFFFAYLFSACNICISFSLDLSFCARAIADSLQY